MNIIIDAMGGDNAPAEILKGTCLAVCHTNIDITLVGDKNKISECAKRQTLDISKFRIVHTDEIITMDDDPVTAVHKKKNSSMMIALKLLADGQGDVLVSAGNTGALFSGATLIVKRENGIKRAAIGTLLPGIKPCLLLDAGANVTVTEDYLDGIENPEVGILNNGTEECKGTSLQIETGKRLRANNEINFIGNVEASAVMTGVCDVVVCDGFTGNVFLKATEGMGKQVLSSLKKIYTKNAVSKLSYLMVRSEIANIKKRFDPAEHGGSPILGIAKPVIKAHGSSDAVAFENAIIRAIQYAEQL